MSHPKNLVYIDEYGLLGSNFYWDKREVLGLSEEELALADMTDARVRVSVEIIKPLKSVDEALKKTGFRLYIKEGYRSEELYNLAYRKRVEKFGKEETERLLNMQNMPHATGKTVDVTLWDPVLNKEVALRDRKDGADAYFIDFYKNRADKVGQNYQKLQNFLRSIMSKEGFIIGVKNEYFHFNYVGKGSL